jgi:hypothetical protein
MDREDIAIDPILTRRFRGNGRTAQRVANPLQHRRAAGAERPLVRVRTECDGATSGDDCDPEEK